MRLVFIVSAAAVVTQARLYPGRTGHYNAHLSSKSIQTSLSCLYTYQTVSGDSCSSVSDAFSMSDSLFQQMNPTANCTAGSLLPEGELVCVSSAAVENSSSGVMCEVGYVMRSGDSCTGVMDAFGISSTTLIQLNPNITCGNAETLDGEVLCLEGTVSDSVVIGGPTGNSTAALRLTSGCTSSIILSASDQAMTQTCVEFVSMFSNVTITQLAEWNTNLNCWDLAAYESQYLCINSASSSTGMNPVFVNPSSSVSVADIPVSVSTTSPATNANEITSTTSTTTTTTSTSTTTTTTISTTTSTTSTTTTTTTTEDIATTAASSENSGAGSYDIKFTYYGNGKSASASIFMCGKAGYASQMPSDPTSIIAISQTLGLKLFSAYMTTSQIDNFESVASPMCLSQIEITAGGTTVTKTIFDVCDDTNGCATNDVDFWDPEAVVALCGGNGGACDTTAYLNPLWHG
ncbi:hypothetical protein HDU82_001332 [Entophlyctis luteolus]|nr:hypothetical protein HDU82_001332 [Entophlyctis luteolus]